MADLILVAIDSDTITAIVNQPISFTVMMEGNDDTQSDVITSIFPYVYQLDFFGNQLNPVPFSLSNSFNSINGLVVPRKLTQDEIDAGEVQALVAIPFALTFFAPNTDDCTYAVGCTVTDQYMTQFDTGNIEITVSKPT